jgi:bacteriocin-like protein
MTTSIKPAAPSKQVLSEPNRELNDNELELVTGGSHAIVIVKEMDSSSPSLAQAA